MGSRKSSSASSSAVNTQDNRMALDNGAVGIGAGASATLNSTTYNADAEAINRQNVELLRDLGGQQTDAVRAVAALGAGNLQSLGGAATDILATSGANSARAWELTLNAAQDVLGGVGNLAAKVVQEQQNSESKAGDAILNIGEGMKYAAIAAAAVVALNMLSKKD